jgi:hypothetical protein
MDSQKKENKFEPVLVFPKKIDKKKGMEKIAPEIQNKIIEEWNEIAKNHIPHSESSKYAWVEFSNKIEKEYGIDAWTIWKMVRG